MSHTCTHCGEPFSGASFGRSVRDCWCMACWFAYTDAPDKQTFAAVPPDAEALLKKLDAKRAALEEELEQAEDERTDLEDDLADIEDRLEDAEQKCRELEAQLEALERERHRIERSARELVTA